MNPELNHEYPEPDETKLIEEMVAVAVERMKPQNGRLRRGQHAKATGCVRGVFTVRDDVPEALRFGIFRRPTRSFAAMIRFSNASESFGHDGMGDARGMAVKLLDVDGEPAIPGAESHCQDFVTVNHPVFPFATPADYVKFFEIRTTPVVGDLLAGAWFALFHAGQVKDVAEIVGAQPVSPLLTYWSGSPYWLGPPGTTGGHAVKYSLVPRFSGKASPPDEPAHKTSDFLSRALAEYLRTQEALFDFCVQLQTDPVAMPVEDTSVEWNEEVSKPIHVATLTIGVQDVDSPEGRALAEECETMAFSPWNALAAHRPLGGINRLRQAVYLASQAKRAAKNSV
jgi:hypothetical protein